MVTMSEDRLASAPLSHGMWSRREVLGAGGALLLGGGIAGVLMESARREHGWHANVFIGRTDSYEADLVAIIGEGLQALGVTRQQIRGKRILLKPNLVETARGESHINTHPAVVVAASETFRRLDARDVIVAEGQGHRRDSRLVLDESGMGRALEEAGPGAPAFAELNHDELVQTSNRGRWTSLESLYLPQTVLNADWIVSMPKLKTHHWVGVTCAMKNMFGVMPGIAYGWPKNVLHHEGIHEAILDIHATVRPHFAIVDAIVGMEGDGPIMGSPKFVGGIIMGRNLPAVDATATRVMGLNAYGLDYLKTASGHFGPIHECNIAQRGEPIETIRTRFDVLDVPHLANVTAT
jgi:uncharacterized protein (DUF362 family)